MAATVVDVFLNQSMVAFLDKDRTMPYQGMVAANIHSADCTCTDTCNIKPTAPLPVNCGEKSITLPVNKGFTKKQTLFLIHLMRIHLEVKGEGTAKSIHALNRRLKFGKKSKKLRRWEEIAGKLAKQFGEHFQQLKPVQLQFETPPDPRTPRDRGSGPTVLPHQRQRTGLPHLCRPPELPHQRSPPAPLPHLLLLPQPVRLQFETPPEPLTPRVCGSGRGRTTSWPTLRDLMLLRWLLPRGGTKSP
ncbi:unnamed protein product [Boreogadus saida]